MKRIFLSFILCCTLFSILQAQDQLRFGFETSPFVSWIKTDNKKTTSESNKLGLNLAVNGEYAFADKYAIRVGLGLSFGQGGSLKHNEINGFGKLFPNSELSSKKLDSLTSGTIVKYSLNYIEIPFALKMKTPEYGNIRYFAEVPAFAIGFKTGAKADIGSYEDENIKQDIALLSLTWGLGGGIEYSLNGNTAFVGGLYYQAGFTDVTTDDGVDKSKAVNHRIVLRIGILF
jgi:hypothetical protein